MRSELARRVAWATLALLILLLGMQSSYAGGDSKVTTVIVVPRDYPTLADAVVHAPPGALIYIEPDTHPLIARGSGKIIISKPLIIVGSKSSSLVVKYAAEVIVKGAKVKFVHVTFRVEHELKLTATDDATLDLIDVRFVRLGSKGSYCIMAKKVEAVRVLNSVFLDAVRVPYKCSNIIEVKDADRVVISNTTLDGIWSTNVRIENTGEAVIASNLLVSRRTDTKYVALILINVDRAVIVGNAIANAYKGVLLENVGSALIGYNTITLVRVAGIEADSVNNLVVVGNFIASSWEVFKLSHVNATLLGNIVFGEREEIVGRNFHLNGGANDFYGERSFASPDDCKAASGILDAYYNLRGFYEPLAGRLNDSYGGPIQIEPGPDGVADTPTILCGELVSLYASLKPVLNETAILRHVPPIGKLYSVTFLIARGNDGAKAYWIPAPVDPASNISITLTVDSRNFDGGISIILQNLGPFLNPAGGIECNGYCIANTTSRGTWLLAVELDTHIDKSMGDPSRPHLALQYMAPSHDQSHTLGILALGSYYRVAGRHIIRVDLYSNLTVAVWFDGKQAIKSRVPAKPTGRMWLGVVVAKNKGSISWSISEITITSQTLTRHPVDYKEIQQILAATLSPSKNAGAVVEIPAYKLAVNTEEVHVNVTYPKTVTHVTTVKQTYTVKTTLTIHEEKTPKTTTPTLHQSNNNLPQATQSLLILVTTVAATLYASLKIAVRIAKT